MASTLLGQLSTIQSGNLVRASVRIWFVLSSSACRFPVSLLKKANIPMVSKTRRVIVRTDSAAKAARRSLLLVSRFSTTGVRRRTSSYVRRPAIKAESKCSLSTRNRAMPVRIQDEIADPGEVLKKLTCRESWVRGSSLRDRLPTRHTIDVDAAKLDYPSEISSMMLHHAAAEPNIQKRPDGGIWGTKLSSSLLPASA
jgi:hypothetical protein